MKILYHGSTVLFRRFELDRAGEGSGIKFGFGVYLTESEASAVHYSVPRIMGEATEHYLYTVEIPELTADNHLTSSMPVPESIVVRVEAKMGVRVPEAVKAAGKDFRKWIGMALLGTRRNGVDEEKAAAELLDSVGVLYNVWPQAQTKPDGLRNIAVFNPDNVRIVRCERIEVVLKGKKWVMKEGARKEVN